MTSRQVIRAERRENNYWSAPDRFGRSVPTRSAGDWRRAIHAPPPQDPPHRKGVSDMVIAKANASRKRRNDPLIVQWRGYHAF